MGIVNVTPDSFSDGGRSSTPSGRSSTGASWRPTGADIARRRRRVDAARAPTRSRREDELERVAPGRRGAGAAAARPGLDRHLQGGGRARRRSTPGAAIVNDVTALRADPELAGLVRRARLRAGADAHARHAAHDAGGPELRRRRRRRQGRSSPSGSSSRSPPGSPRSGSGSIPGIGFGKTVEHNLELLRRLGELRALGRPIVVGTSRKSFLGKLTGPRGRRAARRHDRLQRARARRRAPRSSASTTCRRVRQALEVAEAILGATPLGTRCDGSVPMTWRTHGGDDEAPTRRSRSSSAASRSTRTTASPTPSRRSASGSSSTSRFDVPDCDAVLTDRLEDTVDYAEVCDIVALAATERSYRTLERLCQRDRRAADGALRLRARCGSGPRSPSRRSRSRSRRSRSRSSAARRPRRTTMRTAEEAE